MMSSKGILLLVQNVLTASGVWYKIKLNRLLSFPADFTERRLEAQHCGMQMSTSKMRSTEVFHDTHKPKYAKKTGIA